MSEPASAQTATTQDTPPPRVVRMRGWPGGELRDKATAPPPPKPRRDTPPGLLREIGLIALLAVALVTFGWGIDTLADLLRPGAGNSILAIYAALLIGYPTCRGIRRTAETPPPLARRDDRR